MARLTGEIERLPKWAQQYIADLQRERETAVDALNKYCDSQTESPIFIDELECLGEQSGPSSRTRYVHARHLSIIWEGVQLSILLREDAIDLHWHSANRTMGDVALIPRSYQQVYLKSKEKMRS